MGHRRHAAVLAVIAGAIAGYIGYLDQPRERLSESGASPAPPVTTVRLLGGTPIQLTIGLGLVWVLTCERNCSGRGLHSSGELISVNPGTGRITQRIKVLDPTAFTIGGGAIWLTHFNMGTVSRIDPRRGDRTKTVSLALPTPIVAGDRRFLPVSLSAGPRAVWVSTARGWVARIDARSGRVTAMFAAPFDITGGVAVGPHATWIAESVLGIGVLRPGSRHIQLRAIPTGRNDRISVDRVAVGGGIVWTYGETDSGGVLTGAASIVALDERNGRIIHRLRIPAGPYEMTTSGDGSLFAADVQNDRLYRIDREYRIHQLRDRPGTGTLVAATRRAIWTTTNAGALRRLAVPTG